jgi:peptidyl-dipeptidase Dcp
VPRDYVEFPAQFMEHYVLQPQVLKQYAKHVKTGAIISDDLIARMLKAEKFNQGFATVEFVASALVDQRFHALSKAQAQNIDAAEFERKALAELGAIPQIPMRHRSPHFAHVFGGGYSAAYYAYMWSDVLDSDGFAAFEETGDIFNPALASRLKQHVYSAGNTRDWNEGYIAFRGKGPTVDALLADRGLKAQGAGSTGGGSAE